MGGEESVQRLSRRRLRQLLTLKTSRGRRDQGLFLIDGEKLVRDALDAEAPIAEILSATPELWIETEHSITRLSRDQAERLSDTRTPQGQFAVVRDELGSFDAPPGSQWQIVALDAVQDAGNVGGIIRSAAAFEVDAVLVGAGSADPANTRVTRAATGAWFRVPISRSSDLAADLAALKERGASLVAADPSGRPLHEQRLPTKVVWLFGNEGAGISEELKQLVDEHVAVPVADGVDSLNVSVAAGIILHHAAQRLRERIGK